MVDVWITNICMVEHVVIPINNGWYPIIYKLGYRHVQRNKIVTPLTAVVGAFIPKGAAVMSHD